MMLRNPRLTVRGLLDEELLAKAVIRAGKTGVEAPLTWLVPGSEALADSSRLDEQAVYLTADDLGRDPDAVVAGLRARGTAAVIIDGHSGVEFGSDTVDSAYPVVVELVRPVGFTAINRLMAERSLNQEMHVMRYSSHVHAALAELFHRGAGMATLIREVSALANHPAVALDDRGHVVAQHGLGAAAGGRATLHALHEALRPGQPAAASSAASQHLKIEVPTEYPVAVRAAEETAPLPRPNTSDSPHTPWTCTVSPVLLGRRFEGWVAVLANGPAPGPHDLARHAVVTEQATAIIGSEMLRQRSIDEAEERARGDFVQALVHGSFTSDHDLRARADYHEVDLAATFAVFVAPGLMPAGNTEAEDSGGLVRLARYAAGLLPHPDIRSYVTVIGDVLVVVRSMRAHHHDEVEAEIGEYAEAMAADLRRRRGRPVPVASGRAGVGAAEIRESYRQARVALAIAGQLDLSGSVPYRTLRGYEVLELVAGTERSRALVHDVLGPLRAGTELHHTLVAYLNVGGNVNAAARALNVHRNTMLSKLDRISASMHVDIRDPENQFTIWLAIRLELLDHVQDSVAREARYH